MLILFDGLDEVATVDERRVLIEEIESFAQCYPGNRFLVTSRPVGYDLASLSDQIFSQAQIQPFDDKQIYLFLEHWYTHVLRLSPLSPDDQEELKELFTNLKENPRLHNLAENPLLLTVITALHRYERLPDKRILVYDRCADLLLETWAKIKRYEYTLARSQIEQRGSVCMCCTSWIMSYMSSLKWKQNEIDEGENKASSKEEFASDVPSTIYISTKLNTFSKIRISFPSIAEQNVEAKRFLDLIQEEAGLMS